MWSDKVLSLSDSSPDSLYDICMEKIVNNLNIVTKLDPTDKWRILKDDIILPTEICESFMSAYQCNNRINDNVVSLFRDRGRTRLKSVRLRNSRITDEGLRCLMEHKPQDLELVQCEYLSQASLDIINAHSDNLISLKFGPLTYVLTQDEHTFRHRGYIIKAPKLRRLTIQRKGLAIYPLLLLKTLSQLTHLDLSECSAESTEVIWALHELKQLLSLILHNVYWSKDVIDWIASLRSLRHLDISQPSEALGKYFVPNDVLTRLVTNLPNLESLDISGTNLAGSGAAVVSSVSEGPSGEMVTQVRCDIPGLVSRVNNPLQFLGLYATHHGACKRHDIPARVVSIV